MALVLGTLTIEFLWLFLLPIIILVMILYLRHWRLNRNAIITNWPILGMLPGLFHNVSRLHNFVAEGLEKSNGTFEFKSLYFSNTDFLITCDPLNIQHIFTTNFANYPKGPEFQEVFDVFGDGYISADSDLWRLQRNMFQLWNSQQSKSGFVSSVIHKKVVDDLIPFLEHVSKSGIQIDLQEVFRKIITFDNAISLIFGFDIASSHNFKISKAQYQKAFEDMSETILRRHFVPTSIWKLQRWLQIGGERNHKKGSEILDKFLYDCLSMKRQEFFAEENESNNSDMISTYLEDQNKENPKYSDKFMKDVAMSLTTGACETFTSILTWFFWLVATHPLVEAEIFKEILDNNLGPKKEDDYGYLSKLVYLQAALQETLRLYPAVPFNNKTAAGEDILPSGHHVKPKQRVLLSFYATGRMREIWGEDCLEFKPERWIDPDKRDCLVFVPKHKFPAFNVGPRTCMGKDMALIQSKVVVVNVLKRYRVHVVEGHPVSPSMTITLHTKHGLMINVSKRN